MTLHNLGALLFDMNRIEEAQEDYEESLIISRQLAVANPEVYLGTVADTLDELANLHANQGRNNEALKIFGEALPTYRQLAVQNPEVYLPSVARADGQSGEPTWQSTNLPKLG